MQTIGIVTCQIEQFAPLFSCSCFLFFCFFFYGLLVGFFSMLLGIFYWWAYLHLFPFPYARFEKFRNAQMLTLLLKPFKKIVMFVFFKNMFYIDCIKTFFQKQYKRNSMLNGNVGHQKSWGVILSSFLWPFNPCYHWQLEIIFVSLSLKWAYFQTVLS